MIHLAGNGWALRSKCWHLAIAFIGIISLSVCNAQGQGTIPVKLVFNNMVDSMPVQLETVYKNPFGEDYSIRMFKYYISNIAIGKADGKTVHFDGSYLVNEADSSTKTISLNLPATGLTSISFLLGVDSTRNVTGVQTGDLDPIKGMFWTWNSGYIMAKLEASSSVSTAPNNSVSYHIGGFRTGQQTARTITIPLQGGEGKKVNEIIIAANVNNWFSGVHNLPITEHSVCTTPGNLATQYADNYAKMFRLASIK
jgi:hypothetical protein